jgi:RNA polymerase sigma-32 factor
MSTRQSSSSHPSPSKRKRKFAPQATLPAVQKTQDLSVGDELTRYLNEVRRYPLLDKEEEQTLARDYYENSSRSAAQRLVTGNLRLVVKIAMEYRRNWANVMDLIQEGNMGLAEAVKRFDPYRGVRFSSFARYWIRALILQYILKNFRMVSFANTRAGRKLFFRLEKERNRLIQMYGEATTKQLAENLEVSEKDIETAEALRQPTLSLDAPMYGDDDEGGTLSDRLKDGSSNVEHDVIAHDFSSIISGHMNDFGQTLVNEREIQIWHERLLSEEPKSLSSLARDFGVSRERVRQIEVRLKQNLKKHLSAVLGDELTLDLVSQDS